MAETVSANGKTDDVVDLSRLGYYQYDHIEKRAAYYKLYTGIVVPGYGRHDSDHRRL